MAKGKIKEQSNESKLTVPEVIVYLKDTMGITFNLMDEQKAATFLSNHNYFFRIKQYAQAFPERTKSGKYVGVDFGHLVELSTVDMFLRKLLLKMTIDLEHYLKVQLVNDCQNNPADNGFEVVQDFLQSHPKAKESLMTGAFLAGYGGINFEKYRDTPAVWNVVGMLGFHDFISFFAHYYRFFNMEKDSVRNLDSVRRLRNACAHNVCLLCSFKPAPTFKYDVSTSFELLQTNLGISPGIVTTCMKVPLLNDFAVMLSVYTKLVSSPPIKQKTLAEMQEFF